MPTIRFTAGTTTTFPVKPLLDGWTITSITAAQHFLAFSGAIPFGMNGVTVSYSAASPANTWFAIASSVDAGNNSGWIFGTVAIAGTSRRFPILLSQDNNEAAKAAATLAASSADASYPASNLKLTRITKVWRSAAAAISGIQVTVDCASPKAVNFIAVGNHNLTATGSVVVEAGSTASVVDFVQSIPWRQFDMFLCLASSATYRYWRFTFTDAASTDNFIEAGSVVLGNATILASPFSYDWTKADEYENRSLDSEFGVANVDELFYRVRLRCDFVNKPTTEIDALRAFFKSVKRNVTPFWFVPDLLDVDAYYARFIDHFERHYSFKSNHSASIEVLEESRGNKIAS